MNFRDFDLNVTAADGSNSFDLNELPENINEHTDENDVFLQQSEPSYVNTEKTSFDAAGYNGGMQLNKKKRWLTNEQQDIVYRSLLRISHNGKLKRSATTVVANMFELNIRQVQRIWERRKGTPLGEIRVTQKRGRKKIQIDVDRILQIPLKLRTTLECLANELGVSYGTLFRRFQEGVFRRHSRLQFCVSMIDQSTLPNEPKFKGMYNVIHIDEKWFYMTRKVQNYYLHPLEDDPSRSVQNKNFIGKVMFLAAMEPTSIGSQHRLEGHVLSSDGANIQRILVKEA